MRGANAEEVLPKDAGAPPPFASGEHALGTESDLGGHLGGAEPGSGTDVASLARGKAAMPGTDRAVGPTRASRAWVRILPALGVLAVILLFVFQNLKDVKVRFVTASFTMPLAVDLIAAAALGAILVLAIGSVRILQLRRALRRRSASRPAR
jgi:uncharacterized integral membrane protein